MFNVYFDQGHMLENCKRLICSPSLNKVYCIVLYWLSKDLKLETEAKKNLEKENKKLYEELIEEVKQNKLREGDLLSETESLKQYTEKLEKNKETDKNGKDLSTVSPTTRWRYLTDLKTRAQKALWFMNAYGLKLKG